jgi:hypothetical protein
VENRIDKIINDRVLLYLVRSTEVSIRDTIKFNNLYGYLLSKVKN